MCVWGGGVGIGVDGVVMVVWGRRRGREGPL